MNETSVWIVGIVSGAGLPVIALLLSLTGCVGYVQGDGGGAVVAEPDFFWFGGYDDGGRARGYGQRGAESRGFGGHAGGGGRR
jgi:hypothetical protein